MGEVRTTPFTHAERVSQWLVQKLVMPWLFMDRAINKKLEVVMVFLQKVTTMSSHTLALGALFIGTFLFTFSAQYIDPSPTHLAWCTLMFVVWAFLFRDIVGYLWRKGKIKRDTGAAIDPHVANIAAHTLFSRNFFLILVVTSVVSTTVLRLYFTYTGTYAHDPHGVHYFCPHDVGVWLMMIAFHWVPATYMPPWQRKLFDNRRPLVMRVHS